jgi:hypothetical protein
VSGYFFTVYWFPVSTDELLTILDSINRPSYKSHRIPFPIIIADAFSVDDEGPDAFVPGTSLCRGVVYEFTPVEFGSYDPKLASFLPMQYLGTSLNAGKVDGLCVKGFNKASFVFGASSNLVRRLLSRSLSNFISRVPNPIVDQPANDS